MELSADQLAHLARLSRLELTSEEQARFAVQIPDILGFVAQLDQLQTGNVPPATQMTGLSSVLRTDEVNHNVDRETMLSTMPDTDASGALRVPMVVHDAE